MQAVNQIRGEVSKSNPSSAAMTDAQIKEAEKLFTTKLHSYRQSLCDKSSLYLTLLSHAKSLIHRDDLQLKNESELTRLKYECELQALELHQKREIVSDLQGELEREKLRYKALKVEIKRLEKRAEQLQIVLK